MLDPLAATAKRRRADGRRRVGGVAAAGGFRDDVSVGEGEVSGLLQFSQQGDNAVRGDLSGGPPDKFYVGLTLIGHVTSGCDRNSINRTTSEARRALQANRLCGSTGRTLRRFSWDWHSISSASGHQHCSQREAPDHGDTATRLTRLWTPSENTRSTSRLRVT